MGKSHDGKNGGACWCGIITAYIIAFLMFLILILDQLDCVSSGLLENWSGNVGYAMAELIIFCLLAVAVYFTAVNLSYSKYYKAVSSAIQKGVDLMDPDSEVGLGGINNPDFFLGKSTAQMIDSNKATGSKGGGCCGIGGNNNN